MPRLVLPTPEPLFWRERNCRPETLRSTATAGVHSTRRETPARSSAKPLAAPSPAAAASRSTGKEIARVNPASVPRSAGSTRCPPALCGRRPEGVHPAGVGDVGAAKAGSFPIGSRSAADQIAPFVLLLALVNAMIRSYKEQLQQIHPVVQGFEIASSHFPGMPGASTPHAFGNALSAGWIPPCAGMTGVRRGIPFEMTPAPARRGVCTRGSFVIYTSTFV